FLQARQALAAEKEDIEDRLSTLARDLRVIQEISQTSVEERDLQQLMNRVVNLIIERFSQIYHAQIFIVEERNEFAVLRASTGEAGKNLLARGHRLPVGSVSVIGQVTEQGQLVVARDTAASEVHRRNEFLYETRAELAIPLQINGRIIGALDVQSRYNDSFDEAMTNALTMLADQLTIAIENARLFTESQRFLNDLEATQRETVRRRWAEYLTQQRGGQLYSNSGQNTGYDFSELTEMAQQEGRAVIGEATDRDTIPFVVPIMLREQLLGFAEYEVRKQDFHPEMVVLAEELVGRLALGIDNARLFNESQQTAERERIVNEISARITGKTEVADILQTAISEVSRVLRTPKVAARLHTGQAAVSENGHNNGHT
ncbi:MAG: GAF domain-containing protein, partial [Anaerolineae bacterium]|nr:GAF domain-containing protein [Anaerolineae bacterium]